MKSSNAHRFFSSGFSIFKVGIEELSKECKSEARPKPIAEILKLRGLMGHVSDHVNQMSRSNCFDEDSHAKLIMSIEEYQAILDEAWEAYGNREKMAMRTAKKLCSGLASQGNSIVENTQEAFVVQIQGGPEAIRTGHTKSEVEKKKRELRGGE